MSLLSTFLQGLRVVDVSAYLPGPMASLLLADMGADVAKVEPPQGDGGQPPAVRLDFEFIEKTARD
ncbi:MAG: alpha-methylacyl-CoA racemase [Acetobacteraceae bacterium]|jgi:crotonobetainyl-CoA:carnitine CoA-transferase CaiB-like acyl-CoA transferase|nr:alpha-methylacyl-CoA racemase [Acetobacteraceae bacterium]